MRSLAALLLLLLPGPLAAHSFSAGEVQIGHPHAPPSATADGVEVSMTLVNRGGEGDRLIGVSSPAVREAVLCDNEHRKISGVALEPRKPIALRPGRAHVHLYGLSGPLSEHDRVPLTLVFERAGPVEVYVLIEAEGSH